MYVALPRLWMEIDLDPSSEQTFIIEDGTFILHASPRGSYGYLYISAWVG